MEESFKLNQLVIYVVSQLTPDLCKVPKLKSLYKKGLITQPCNYRPTSLLPLMSKVLRRVVHDQTSTFLNPENLLYTYQSGVRKENILQIFAFFVWMTRF